MENGSCQEERLRNYKSFKNLLGRGPVFEDQYTDDDLATVYSSLE